MKTKSETFFRRAVVVILTLYTAAGGAFLFLKGRMLPVPMAELLSMFYAGIKNERLLLAVISAVAILFVFVFINLSVFGKRRLKLPMKILILFVLLFDMALHVYVFLATFGFQLNYLISGALDTVLAVMLFYRNKKRSKR